jgi:hypothetical protein
MLHNLVSLLQMQRRRKAGSAGGLNESEAWIYGDAV